MSHYLVTGGAGFIGANLVKRLLADGHSVTVLDNYAAGKKSERMHQGAEYIDGDIRSRADMERACRPKPDGIFHLAAVPRVIFSVEHPEETHDVNVNGTLNVLLVARDLGVKRMVFATSSAAYGDQDVYPVTEAAVKKPVSPYGLHKLVGEEYCRAFSLLYGLETVSLCYFNVYGHYFDPDGPYALVIGKFLKQRQDSQPMTIRGDGEFYRDFTHVDDTVEATILAMTQSSVGKGEVINIGYGESHSVNEVARLIGGDVVFVPPLPGEMKFTHADNTKANQLLGWEPKISLEEGIRKLKEEWGL